MIAFLCLKMMKSSFLENNFESCLVTDHIWEILFMTWLPSEGKSIVVYSIKTKDNSECEIKISDKVIIRE